MYDVWLYEYMYMYDDDDDVKEGKGSERAGW